MIHRLILKIAIDLGYLGSDARGVCHGFTVKWLESHLLGERQYFNKRIKYIVTQSNVVQKIASCREKMRDLAMTFRFDESDENSQLLAIYAFFDSLVLYQNSGCHQGFFGSTYVKLQNIDVISYYAASASVQAQGGLVTIYSEPGIYTQSELKDYLQLLAQAVNYTDDLPYSEIGFMLHIGSHALGLTYDRKSAHWCYMDINHWPPQLFSSEGIVDRLFHYFKPGNFLALNIHAIILVSNPHRLQLTEKLTQFKHSHILTQAMAERRTDVTLLWLASRCGQVDMVSSLLEMNVNPELAHKKYGVTPLWMAAQAGHIDVVAKLLEFGVTPNVAAKSGWGPFVIAARHGHIKVINLFLAYDCWQHITCTSRCASLMFSAEQGHYQVVAKLLELGMDPNISNKHGFTALWVAAMHGHVDVVAMLLAAGANPDITVEGYSPVLMAETYGHADVVAKLREHINQEGTNTRVATPCTDLSIERNNKSQWWSLYAAQPQKSVHETTAVRFRPALI